MKSGKVVVTGASGFVGRAIVAELLAKGWRVEGWSRRRSTLLPGETWREVDLSRPLEVPPEAAPIAAIVHAGAVAHARPNPQVLRQLNAVNVEGTRQLLDLAKELEVPRLIFLSSIAAQGIPPAGQVGTEQSLCRPIGVYGRAKLQGERLLELWTDQGRQGVALRLPLVYGPGVAGNLRRLVRAGRRGWAITLGPGQSRRSLVARANVADAVATILDTPLRPGYGVYLLTDHRPYTVAELVEGLGKAAVGRPRRLRVPLFLARAAALAGDVGEALLGRYLPFSSGVMARLVEGAPYSSVAFQRDYGWTPQVELDEEEFGALIRGESDG